MRSISPYFLIALLGAAGVPTMAAAAQEACGPLKLVAAMDMRFDGGGRPVLPVTLDGKEKLLLLDTGAFMSMLNRNVFDELGYPVRNTNVVGTHVATGFTSRQYGIVKELVVAGIRSPKHSFFVVPRGEIGRPALAGLLGTELLRQFDIDLDFASGKISFFHPDHCPGRVIYWRPATLAVVPFNFEEQSISFPVTVDGKELTGILDTGASGTYMNFLVAQRRFAITADDPEVEQTGEVEGTSRQAVYRRRFKSLQIQDLSVSNPMITLWPDMGPEQQRGLLGGSAEERLNFPAIVLGMSVLSRLHVYIAYREKKVYITPAVDPGPASLAP